MGNNFKNLKNKTSKNFEFVLFFIIIAIALSLLFKGHFSIRNKSGQTHIQSVGELPAGLHSRINEHLKDGSTKTEILKSQIEIENQNTLNLNSDAPRFTDEERRVHRLRLDQENTTKKIAEEIYNKNQNYRPMTPDERLAQKLERDQYIKDYNEKYQDEYVKQFLENAREKGVNIRLDDDLNVTGLNTFEVEKPIRVPQSVTKENAK